LAARGLRAFSSNAAIDGFFAAEPRGGEVLGRFDELDPLVVFGHQNFSMMFFPLGRTSFQA
jgi:hypothetical protein